VQRAITERLAAYPMDERELGIAMALLSGDRALIDPELREDYSKAGVSHILAISGLHLSILFALLNYTLAPLLLARRGRIVRTALVILCLWGYAFISGLSASVLRAAFMLSILQLSLMTVWSYNSYNALFASAFVLILIRPTFIYDPSFQMSYLALLGILFFYPRFSRWTGVSRAGRWLRRRRDRARGVRHYLWMFAANLFIFTTGAILLGLSAQITVTPLVGWAFGRMPLLSLLANPMIMLVITWLMVAGFCYLILAHVPGLGWLAGAVMSWLLERQNRWVEWIAGWPGASVERVSMPLPVLFLIYASILLAMTGIKYLEQHDRFQPRADDPDLL
jgi:competence protein ComEC